MNHGVPCSLMDDITRIGKDFFQLPSDEKEKHAIKYFQNYRLTTLDQLKKGVKDIISIFLVSYNEKSSESWEFTLYNGKLQCPLNKEDIQKMLCVGGSFITPYPKTELLHNCWVWRDIKSSCFLVVWGRMSLITILETKWTITYILSHLSEEKP